MAIKFEKIQPGMRLADIHSVRMGHTTMRRKGLWWVHVKEVEDKEIEGPHGKFRRRRALVSWNGNAFEWWSEHRLTRLFRENSVTVKKLEEQQRNSRW